MQERVAQGLKSTPKALTLHLSSLPLSRAGLVLCLFRAPSPKVHGLAANTRHKAILPILPLEGKPQGRALIGLPGPDAHRWTSQPGPGGGCPRTKPRGQGERPQGRGWRAARSSPRTSPLLLLCRHVAVPHGPGTQNVGKGERGVERVGLECQLDIGGTGGFLHTLLHLIHPILLPWGRDSLFTQGRAANKPRTAEHLGACLGRIFSIPPLQMGRMGCREAG